MSFTEYLIFDQYLLCPSFGFLSSPAHDGHAAESPPRHPAPPEIASHFFLVMIMVSQRARFMRQMHFDRNKQNRRYFGDRTLEQGIDVSSKTWTRSRLSLRAIGGSTVGEQRRFERPRVLALTLSLLYASAHLRANQNGARRRFVPKD
jgi:hypothetical protein